MSSTITEITANYDAAKVILYVQSILDKINIPQDEGTELFIDNSRALLIANAQQPTRKRRYMDIKYFVLLD